jgi:asparagine synthase (glutamine-hydrolysing)
MRDTLAHRGPDHAGLWHSADRRLAFGHRRLAILDLSPDANQPWVSHDGRFVIVFNGEIYNFRSLKKKLERGGASFRTHSDTEVLVEAYRAWGPACLERFSGMFAFALWDQMEQRLFCARDRAGEKPFYYALASGCFLFGSELKALLAWPGFPRRIHYPALIDYLTFGFVPDPKTIWEGVNKLPPGCALTVRVDGGAIAALPRPVQWWDFEVTPVEPIPDWDERFLGTLEHAAEEMAIADVPLGAFLSGGVDSSSVVAALSRRGHEVRSFTVGFDKDAYDERPWAARIAQRYTTRHTERLVGTEDVKRVFERMVWHFDEPFNDYSYLPTYYVCREARRAITVALSGDGGDELFAGYRKYQRLALRSTWGRALPHWFVALLARLVPHERPLRRTLEQYGLNDRRMLADCLTLGFAPSYLRRFARGRLAQELTHYSAAESVDAILERARPERVGVINSMRYLDLKLTLGAGILTKVDRASMAVSLEVRPVYLHHAMLALAAATPPTLLADRREGKKAVKRALKRWLPTDVLYRRKMGFALPLAAWLRADNADLLNTPSSPLVEENLAPSLYAQLADVHRSGRGDFAARLHSLAFLDRWAAHWL